MAPSQDVERVPSNCPAAAAGLELHIEGEDGAQSHTLNDAERMVRDYLVTTFGAPLSSDSIITITPEAGAHRKLS